MIGHHDRSGGMQREALISDFIERLQRQIGELLPAQSVEAVLEQARRALRQGFGDLELVSRQELEGHLQALRALNDQVAVLEQRIHALEATTPDR
jgi:BMFP domain-containing protein YqiC